MPTAVLRCGHVSHRVLLTTRYRNITLGAFYLDVEFAHIPPQCDCGIHSFGMFTAEYHREHDTRPLLISLLARPDNAVEDSVVCHWLRQ
jgi:hypothetical protein